MEIEGMVLFFYDNNSRKGPIHGIWAVTIMSYDQCFNTYKIDYGIFKTSIRMFYKCQFG